MIDDGTLDGRQAAATDERQGDLSNAEGDAKARKGNQAHGNVVALIENYKNTRQKADDGSNGKE